MWLIFSYIRPSSFTSVFTAGLTQSSIAYWLASHAISDKIEVMVQSKGRVQQASWLVLTMGTGLAV